MSYGELSAADVAAVTRNNDNNNGNGLFGNDWAWIIILLLFGYGGRGFGGNGGFGGGFGGNTIGCGCSAPCATQADVRAAVDQQTLISKLDQQTYGLADSTYALNNAITNGFHGVDNAICNLGYNVQSGFNTLGHQISDCCCETRAAITNVGTSVEKAGWNLSKQISDCCCDLEMANMQNRFDAQTYNCNTLQAIDKLGDRIIGYMSNKETQNLRDEVQTLRLAASQAQQNAFITANQQAQTAELIRRLGADCPQPAYLVNGPTPINFPVNSCGQVQFSNNNCGCGCGCGSY